MADPRGVGLGAIARAPGAVGALLAFAALVRVGAVLNRGLDPDESQHLHAAWLVGQGAVPFRDFWEHHVPLFYYLLAPLTWWLADSPTVYLAGRAVMVAGAAGALALTYRLARRLSREAGVAALLLLALLPEFVASSTELRPDVPALVCWLAALLALVAWRESGAARWAWLAGLAQGTGMALTIKAVYGAAGLAAAAWLGRDRGGWRLRRAALGLGGLVAGAVIPLGGLVATLWLHGGFGAVRGFAEGAVLQNLRFVDFTKVKPVGTPGAGFLLLAGVGVALTVRRQGVRVLAHPVHGVLLPALAVVTLALALPWTPAVYDQAWLPVLAIAAVYAGSTLAALVEAAGPGRGPGRSALLALALVVGLVVPGAESIRQALRGQVAGQLHLMRRLLEEACPGEPVLDGTALYVFRPAAYRYGALINGVREWIARGAISEEQVEGDIRRAQARVAYPDRRLRALVGPVADFLKRHYVAAPDGLLLAGARIEVPGGPGGGRVQVDLPAPGPYRLAADAGVEVAIDGASRRRGWVDLAAGRHQVTWTGPRGRIELVAAGCAERRAQGARPGQVP